MAEKEREYAMSMSMPHEPEHEDENKRISHSSSAVAALSGNAKMTYVDFGWVRSFNACRLEKNWSPSQSRTFPI